MPAVPAFYVWKPPGKAVSVHFDLAVIDALRGAVLKAPHSEAERRDEVGGLLLGRVEPDQNIIVDGFELLSSEHKRGASFILSARDGKKLRTRLQWWLAHNNEREPIGFFRSHTRSGLYLDRNDQEVLSRFFTKPSDVALLVRPAADGTCTGGCFFWEEVAIQGTRTYLEFPFESRRLTSQSYVPGFAKQPEPAPVPRLVEPLVAPRNARLPVAAAVLALMLLPLLAVYAYRASTNRSQAATLQTKKKDTPSQVQRTRVSTPRAGVEWNESIEGLPVIEERVKLSPLKNFQERQPARVSSSVSAPGKEFAPTRQPPRTNLPKADAVLPPPPLEGKSPVHLAVAPSFPMMARIPGARAPSATVVLEPVNESLVRRAVSHVPLVSVLQRHRYKAGDRFFPARPVGNFTPTVPRELRSKISGLGPVDLRITVDKTGAVSETELLTKKIDSAVAELAVRTASRWDFIPARINSRAVTSELLVHMRFGE